MTSEKDGSGDGGSPAWSASKAKRPHAVLDLEATDVTPRRPALTDERPAVGEPPKDGDEFSRGAVADESAAAPAGAAADGAPVDPEATAPPHEKAGWAAAVLAGLGGGALAVVLSTALVFLVGQGTDALAPSPDSLSALQRRLDTLEQAMPLPASPQLGEKIAAIERRAGEVAEAQSLLAAEMRRLAEKAGANDFAALDSRLAKLESQFATLAASGQGNPEAGPIPQLAAVSSKLADIEARGAKAEETARAAAGNVDAVKKDLGRLDQSLGAIKTEAGQTGQAARAAQDEAAALRTRIDGLAAGIEKQLHTAAKSSDIASAIAPVSGKLAALEQSIAAVAASDESRRVNAERILLTLELAGLKRAIERGESYTRELAEVRAASAGKWDLSALERSSERGVPALASLQREFRDVSRAVLDTANEPRDGSVFERLVAGAKSVVRVRKLDHGADDSSVEAVTDRVAKALELGRLDAVIAEAGRLPPKARAAAGAWLGRIEARHAIDGAIAAIENQLRASLTN